MAGNGKPAYVYEVDEQGKAVQGSRQSARKDKDRPKISHRDSRDSRTGKSSSSRKSRSDSGVVAKYQEGISPLTAEVAPAAQLERRKSSASSSKSPQKSTRPPSAHENRGFAKPTTSRKDDPSHYGIPAPTSRAPPVVSQQQQPQPINIPLRPRAVPLQTYPARPLSYHAAYTSGGYATGPPLSASAYYQQPVMPPPSYPPPSPYRYAITPQTSYFDVQPAALVASRPLSSRFDPIQRTASAYGVRDVAPQAYNRYDDDDGYRSASEGPESRRGSIRVPSTRTKAEIDYETMPPPPKPTGILRRPATEYYADSAPDPPQYRDSRSVYREDPPPSRRPSLRRNSVSYDLPESNRVQVFETANKGRRRTSYYGPSNDSVDSSDYDAKVRQAQNYQEDVAGPEPLPLTADMLKRQQQQRRHAGSSRSTKSSGSRDESDYRKSATTRTTRSGSGGDDENVTIKVTGTARVTVGGAQIDCTDGGAIEIKRQMSIRNGSERGSEYCGTQRGRIEDRHSRVDRPSGQSRMSSRSSYTRTTPQWI